MSRPVSPAWSVLSWATNVNYPAGSDPWAGSPTKLPFPGAAGGFVPAQGAASEYFNYAYNLLGATDQSVKDYVTTLKDTTWDSFGSAHANSYIPVLMTSNTFRAPSYDAVSNRWVAMSGSGNSKISYDGGLTWTTVALSSTAGFPVNPSGSNPAGLTAALWVDGGGAGKAYALPANSVTWVEFTVPVQAGLFYFYDLLWFVPASAFIAVGSPATPNSRAIKFSGAANATDISAAIPATINAVRYWTFDVSPTRLVAVPRVVNAVNYMTSDNGSTFTLRTTLPVGAGEQALAVKYSVIEAIWMLIVSHSSGTFKTYTSADGLTWALKSSNVSTGWLPLGLSHADSTWTLLTKSQAGGATERIVVLQSSDGGLTWRPTNGWLPGIGGAAEAELCRMRSNGRQFIAANSDGLVVSSYALGQAAALT